jgi:hypothetical protein
VVKRVLLSFILLLFIICSYGQEPFKKKILIGIKGGGTTSQIRFYPSVDQLFYNGYTGGVAFKIITERHVGIQAEVNYTQKGWRELVSEGLEYSRRLNYIDIPFMTHVSLGKKRFGFFFNIGPSLSFLLSEEEMLNSEELTVSDIAGPGLYYSQPLDNKVDFQFTLGVGARLELKGGNAMELEARGYASLPNIFDTKKYTYQSAQNQLATVTLSYLFSLTK